MAEEKEIKTQEQEYKRELYQAKQRSKIENQLSLKTERQKESEESEKNDKGQEAVDEREIQRKLHLEKAKELANKDKSEGGGRVQAIKEALKATGEGASTEITSQASAFVLNTLWSSVLTIGGIFPALIGLNVYFVISSGIFDALIPSVSQKIAPFGLFTKSLPEGLGKILGIIALFLLDFLCLVLFSIIAVLIVIMVTAITDPWELIKLLSAIAWDLFKSLFK